MFEPWQIFYNKTSEIKRQVDVSSSRMLSFKAFRGTTVIIAAMPPGSYINFPTTQGTTVAPQPVCHEKYPDYISGAISRTDNAARYKLSHKRKTLLILNKKACNSRYFDLPAE